jgi:hypothetical protein
MMKPTKETLFNVLKTLVGEVESHEFGFDAMNSSFADALAIGRTVLDLYVVAEDEQQHEADVINFVASVENSPARAEKNLMEALTIIRDHISKEIMMYDDGNNWTFGVAMAHHSDPTFRVAFDYDSPKVEGGDLTELLREFGHRMSFEHRKMKKLLLPSS